MGDVARRRIGCPGSARRVVPRLPPELRRPGFDFSEMAKATGFGAVAGALATAILCLAGAILTASGVPLW